MIRRIESLQDLQEEKARLEQEIELAQRFLNKKVKNTYERGKNLARSKVSWPLILSSITALGVNKLSTHQDKMSPTTTTYATTSGGFDLKAELLEGISAFQLKGKKRWIALLPIVLRYLEHWTTGHEEQPIKISPP